MATKFMEVSLKKDYLRTRSITMSDAQWTKLKKKAKAKGLTISAYVRITMQEL
jgi:lipocalin